VGLTPELPELPDSDDDGNPLPVPDSKSEVGQLIYLLEWGRLRGFRLGPTIQVGDLIVQVRDLRQPEGRADRDDTTDAGPWAAAGYTDE
jgi:hypothetical protein